ncbi:hypothetical protein RUM44_000576 [Polyplax serrata]|uniref:C2H2-type domain-containing protein n=1 Tax=Polyplax serrata TaxID=468196 RepID=A0ABR1B8R1_POLSC
MYSTLNGSEEGNLCTKGTTSLKYKHQSVKTAMNSEKPKKTNDDTSNQKPMDMFYCDLCGAAFHIKHSITKHKRVVHGMHQFTCMFCHESYPLKRNLLDHILSHQGPHGFKCHVCHKVRPNYVSIQRHVKTHSQKKIPCVKCGAWFKTKWELKSHEIQHKEDRNFNCETCGLTFANPSKMREHKSRHMGDRPYKCDICGKDFNAQGNLTNHRKMHFDDKPYKCHYCSISFLTNSARKKHIQVHEREKRKPYQCQDCNKEYSSTTSLAVHRMKFHAEGVIFYCPYCKEKFETRNAMAEHMTEHASERPHSCDHCLCRYKNKRELRRHQREKDHNDTEAVKGNYDDQKYCRMVEVGYVCDRDEFIDEDDEDWTMPEPEVCIKVVDSDNEEFIGLNECKNMLALKTESTN